MIVATEDFVYKDYLELYKSIMQFNKNKDTYIHGWYPFVEGYSQDFIRGIINELGEKPNCCLEPFAGSGTTPVELQKLGIKCVSFEVNPFMYNLASSKMRTDYKIESFNYNFNLVKDSLLNTEDEIEQVLPPPKYGTITENERLKKWNFNKEVLRGILDIKYALNKLKDKKYKNLFNIALASILLDVSNLYRNGKCLSYKRDWQDRMTLTRQEVHQQFIEKVTNVILPDIILLNKYKKKHGKLFSNHSNCNLGDCRENIDLIEDNSIDLVITSPPYLNSRDYTDTYMLELWMLDHISDYSKLRELRKKTLRSHVQIKWGEVHTLDIEELKVALNKLSKFKSSFWNEEIPGMIKGYFQDLNTFFNKLYSKMIVNGKIYFNVANSAYYGVEIQTDRIVAQIAERNGFTVHEIRRARKLKPSVQQKDKIPFLWEVVLVIGKEGS